MRPMIQREGNGLELRLWASGMHVCICVGIPIVICKQHQSRLDAKLLQHSRNQQNIIKTSKRWGWDGNKGMGEMG